MNMVLYLILFVLTLFNAQSKSKVFLMNVDSKQKKNHSHHLNDYQNDDYSYVGSSDVYASNVSYVTTESQNLRSEVLR